MDVLQLHDRVVHQPPDAQRQAAHCHDVQGLAGEVQRDEGHEHGKRNGHRDDQRAGDVAQEHQDHSSRQDRPFDGLVDEVLDGLPNVHRLIEGDPQLYARRNADHLRQRPAERIHHFDRVGDRLLVHPQVD